MDLTMLLWIRTIKNDFSRLLIAATPVYSTRFSLWPKSDQLIFIHSKDTSDGALTTVDKTDQYEWRHLAVVSKAPNFVKFYKNGHEWKIKQEMPANRTVIKAYQICLFRSPYRQSYTTNATMGMVMIYERELPQEEVLRIYLGEF